MGNRQGLLQIVKRQRKTERLFMLSRRTIAMKLVWSLVVLGIIIVVLVAIGFAALANWQTTLPYDRAYTRDGVSVSVTGITQDANNVTVTYSVSGPAGARAATDAFAFVDNVMERESGGPGASNPQWFSLEAPVSKMFSTIRI